MQKCHKRGKLNVILWMMNEWCSFKEVMYVLYEWQSKNKFWKGNQKYRECSKIYQLFLWMLLLLSLNIISYVF